MTTLDPKPTPPSIDTLFDSVVPPDLKPSVYKGRGDEKEASRLPSRTRNPSLSRLIPTYYDYLSAYLDNLFFCLLDFLTHVKNMEYNQVIGHHCYLLHCQKCRHLVGTQVSPSV